MDSKIWHFENVFPMAKTAKPPQLKSETVTEMSLEVSKWSEWVKNIGKLYGLSNKKWSNIAGFNVCKMQSLLCSWLLVWSVCNCFLVKKYPFRLFFENWAIRLICRKNRQVFRLPILMNFISTSLIFPYQIRIRSCQLIELFLDKVVEKNIHKLRINPG